MNHQISTTEAARQIEKAKKALERLDKKIKLPEPVMDARKKASQCHS